MAWVKPVYDRTLADVTFALQKIQEWKANGTTDTTDLKGCFNASDLLRIENNMRYLADELNSLYYRNDVATERNWSMSSLPNAANITRLINNVNKLWTAYFMPPNSPNLPTSLITYEQVNALEKNLYLIKNMMDSMINSFRECGTFECGEG